MASRAQLQSKLEEILGTRNVYFQPPENVKLQYPCIIYGLNRVNKDEANNNNYIMNKEYSISYISSDPDDLFYEKILALPKSSFDRVNRAGNLYHFEMNLYF